MSVVAALLTGLAGFIAFNVVYGVFADVEAIFGLVACIAVTVFVLSRTQTERHEHERDESVAVRRVGATDGGGGRAAGGQRSPQSKYSLAAANKWRTVIA
jgi:uncharacterized membrane protein YuzA (DUF378 family)